MTPKPLKSQVVGFIACCIVTFTAAALGAIASATAGSFYQELTQPSWAPPAWLFGPVWSALYAMMAVSAWLVWRQPSGRKTKLALGIFLVQLATNALWSWLFFKWHLGALAFVEVLLLWCLIVANVVAFWRLQKVAAVLLLPYLIWVSFAAALCYTMWQLNPDVL